jgi:hypothetical protein
LLALVLFLCLGLGLVIPRPGLRRSIRVVSDNEKHSLGERALLLAVGDRGGYVLDERSIKARGMRRTTPEGRKSKQERKQTTPIADVSLFFYVLSLCSSSSSIQSSNVTLLISSWINFNPRSIHYTTPELSVQRQSVQIFRQPPKHKSLSYLALDIKGSSIQIDHHLCSSFARTTSGFLLSTSYFFNAYQRSINLRLPFTQLIPQDDQDALEL